tara:strand:- start:3648 stop:4421 length:774 start_codon:yes stop_codon:yes gene_type:complete
MAWYNEDSPETLNFMVAGNSECGHDLLQASLSAHPEIICHGDVLHETEALRKTEHEEYFGKSGRVPDWYVPSYLSMEQYLNNKIFDNTLHQEKAVGVKVSYQQFIAQDLWDYTIRKCRQGDFCLVHVQRNPVACFVDYMRSSAWPHKSGPLQVSPSNVNVNPQLLVTFVRKHLSTALKVDGLCQDRAIVYYHELLLDFRGTIEKLFKYLDIRYNAACIPNLKRLRNRDVRSTISNWKQLQKELPLDVREHLESPTLL